MTLVQKLRNIERIDANPNTKLQLINDLFEKYRREYPVLDSGIKGELRFEEEIKPIIKRNVWYKRFIPLRKMSKDYIELSKRLEEMLPIKNDGVGLGDWILAGGVLGAGICGLCDLVEFLFHTPQNTNIPSLDLYLGTTLLGSSIIGLIGFAGGAPYELGGLYELSRDAKYLDLKIQRAYGK